MHITSLTKTMQFKLLPISGMIDDSYDFVWSQFVISFEEYFINLD